MDFYRQCFLKHPPNFTKFLELLGGGGELKKLSQLNFTSKIVAHCVFVCEQPFWDILTVSIEVKLQKKSSLPDIGGPWNQNPLKK